MMAPSIKPKEPLPLEPLRSVNSTGTSSDSASNSSNNIDTGFKRTGKTSKNTSTSSNKASASSNNTLAIPHNPGINSNSSSTSVSNTGIIIGQQIWNINHKYFTTISDKISHKSLAESSFTKYKNLRFHDTCEWLLEEESYKEWAKCSRCQPLTGNERPTGIKRIKISGKVGCGKSTLVARAIDDAKEKEEKGSGHRVLYFFASSSRDDDEARLKDLQPTLKNVLLTFWGQLHVDEDDGIGGTITNDLSVEELRDGIIGKFMASKTTHVSILIDAIDTLSSSDKRALRFMFVEECEKNSMQVFYLTSHTQDSEGGPSNGEIRITTEKIKVDMENFLREKLSDKMLQQDKTGKGVTKEEKDKASEEGEDKDDENEKDKARKELTREVDDIVRKITGRAQEMFLWAAVMLDLVCRAHDKKERERVLERLLLPKYIQDDYEKLVAEWEGKAARGRLEEWQRKLARQATGLLAHKQGLLSYDALTEVLEEELPEAAAQKREAEVQKWEAEAQEQEAEARKRVAQKVVECCSPFMEYDWELRIFRFPHPSMHDFFVKRDASRTSFADQTLAYLCRPAFRRGPFVGVEWWDMGELRPFLDSHPFLGFAATNWVDAVRNSKAANGQNRKSTRNLLANLYGADDNLLLAFQVQRFAAHNTVPTKLRSAHIFSFFGLFDHLFSSSSRFTAVYDAAMTDSDGHNALHWAMKANDAYMRLQMVRILIRVEKAADMVAAKGSSDLTPLHHAARQGDLGVVRLLLSRDPDKRALHAYSKQYGTPLTLAAAHGRADVVEELIKAGADLDVKCELGNVLHAAAAAPDEAAHACVNAILCKHPDPGRLDVDHPKQDGTPLHTAAYCGRQSVVELLLKQGFNARKMSWKHRSTITAAAAGCHREIDHMPFIRIMEMLHDAGAKAHAAGATGYFALHHAAHFNQPEIARFLHNCGAKRHQKSTIGTPLEVAAAQGHMEVVRVLLQPREKRQRAYVRKRGEMRQRLAEKAHKKKEEKSKESTSRDGGILRRVLIAVWGPIWDSAVAANNMARIYWLVDQYEKAYGTAIQKKSSRHVKGLAPLGTDVFTSVVGLMERLREPQENQQKSKSGPDLHRKARTALSSTAKGVLKIHAVCDTTLSYFQLKVHNDRLLRSAATGIEFHPGTYEEILDRLTLAAVRMLSRAFEHNNLDAVSALAEAWNDALLAIDSVGLLKKLVGNRAQALKVILTDTSKTVVEKRSEASVLAKVGIELLADALKRRHENARAARLARSLANLWASVLHDAGGPATDATRVEDIFSVCNAFFEMFRRACKLPSSNTSERNERVKRVRLLALAGAEIVVQAVRTDNEPLTNNMRRMMDLSRKEAATAGLKEEVNEELTEKQKSLEEAGSTAPPEDETEKWDSVTAGQITPVQDESSSNKSNTEHGGSKGDVPQDDSSEIKDGKLKTNEIESRRLRITLRILRGGEGVITTPYPQTP